MEICVVKEAGFCFGVKRAISMAFKVAEDENMPAVTLGPIIHNPQVIERLAEKGVRAVEEIPDDNSVIIIRTHGIEKSLHEEIQAKGHRVIDATCPFVKKAQQYARLLSDEGYQVLILGDARHPEVRGILSFAGPQASVIAPGEPLPSLRKKVGIVVQTTQPIEALQGLVSHVIGRVTELKVFNTICNSTALRLKETEDMARRVDLMIVVGGKNSANTTQLRRLCESLGTRTYHVETADEIRQEWLEGVQKVGITAGASTPEWIIDSIKEKIEDTGG